MTPRPGQSRLPLAAALAAGLGASLAVAAALGPPVGSVVLVQRTVLALAAGQPDRQLRFNDPIADGLRVRLVEKESFLKVRFFSDQVESLSGIGIYTLQGQSDAALQRGPARDAAGRLLSTVMLYLGRLRLALRPGGGAQVQTPDAVMGIKGTAVRLLVDPAAGTFVAVEEGEATVQAKAGGPPARVGAGHWVIVPPGGVPGRPEALPAPGPRGQIVEDPPLLSTCCARTEPGGPPRR